MQILIERDYAAICMRAARLVAEEIENKRNIVLGLATGSTPLGVYQNWIDWVREETLSFASVRTFNLDEYLGLVQGQPQSYWTYMQEKLFRHIDIKPGHIHMPRGDAPDEEAHCREYDRLIEEAGGIDIQILGIGQNGHIGFNEPGEAFGRGTHVVKLAESTRHANARFFAKEEEVPTHAVTMGLRSIMNARQILLLASGASKSDAVLRALTGPVSEDCPASILQLHPQCVFLLDEEAAAKLPSRDFCMTEGEERQQ